MNRRILCLLVAIMVCGVAPVHAATSDALRVEADDVSEHPAVGVTVTVPLELAGDTLTPQAFTLTEDGEPRPLNVETVRGTDLDVTIILDTTGSMRGAPIDDAKAAALSFLDQLPLGTSVSVMAYNTEAYLVSDFSDDMAAHVVAIQGVEAKGRTALYDAVAAAVDRFETRSPAERAIVLLTDGQDNASSTSLTELTTKLAGSDADMFGVAYNTAFTDEEGLRQIVRATDGRIVRAEDPEGLLAVYGEIAAELSSQYRLSYTSTASGKTDVAVQLRTDAGAAQGEVTLQFPALPPPAADAPQPAPAPSPLQRVLANRWLLFAGAALIFVSISLICLLMLLPGGRSRTNVLTSGTRREQQNMPKMREGLTDLASHLTEAAEKSLSERSFGAKLNTALERAGINLRPAEFMVLSASIALTAGAVGTILATAVLGLVFAVFAIFGTRAYVSMRGSRRQSKFGDQLNDTLQLLAGSLRAGYGMMQAIDSVAREAQSPTAEEFGRLVVEARLGRDLTAAMQAMGQRLDSEDFEWVIQAIAIHREVGGDLAEVLDTVASTIRERNQIRRQIKALSAEGKLSGIILTLLPVAVGTLIGASNPTYMAPLFQSAVGIAALSVGFCLMVAGGFWMRHFINLKF